MARVDVRVVDHDVARQSAADQDRMPVETLSHGVTVRIAKLEDQRHAICLRRYRQLGELYDAVLKLAVLGRSDVGLLSTLSMTGVTFENVDRVTRRYLRLVAWR